MYQVGAEGAGGKGIKTGPTGQLFGWLFYCKILINRLKRVKRCGLELLLRGWPKCRICRVIRSGVKAGPTWQFEGWLLYY